MSEDNNIVIEQNEETTESAQTRPDFPQGTSNFSQGGHRRPGPGMPPPMNGQQGGRPGNFTQPTGSDTQTAEETDMRGYAQQSANGSQNAQGGHRRPGPGMPPPPMNGQQGGHPGNFQQPTGSDGEDTTEQ